MSKPRKGEVTTHKVRLTVNEDIINIPIGEKKYRVDRTNTLRNRLITAIRYWDRIVITKAKHFYGYNKDHPIKDGEILAYLMGISFEDMLKDSAYEIYWNNEKRFAMCSLPNIVYDLKKP